MTWAPHCAWYVGCPRAGKTYLALQHVLEDQRATRFPVLLVDSTEADNFDGIEHATNCEDALIGLLAERRPMIAWTPRDGDEMDAGARAIKAAGRMHVLIDEAAYWIGASRGRGGSLLRLLRAYRHAQVSLHLTTQHFSGDVSAEALACAPDIYCFRTTSTPALVALERDYGLNPAEVSALPAREYKHVRLGF